MKIPVYYDDLNTFFHSDTVQEKWHKVHQGQLSERYTTMKYDVENGNKTYIFDFSNEMISRDLVIFKESRYTILPSHRHYYLEVNYVYCGHSVYLINGQKIELKQGDIVILEPDVVHSAEYKNENDIVINFAMREEYYKNIVTRYNDNEMLYTFLFDCLQKNRIHNKYLVFRHSKNPMLDMTMQSIFYLYYGQREPNFGIMIEEYIHLMFLQLVNAGLNQSESMLANKEDSLVVAVLKIIQETKGKCDLSKISEEFGYNYNYFSNLIKKKTGKNFSELRKSMQYLEVRDMLKNSDLPIDVIARSCGFSNLSYFYKMFSKMFGITPGEYRSSNL